MSFMPTRDGSTVSKDGRSKRRMSTRTLQRPDLATAPAPNGAATPAESRALASQSHGHGRTVSSPPESALPGAGLLAHGLPGPGLPGPLRWGLSVGLALGVPLLLAAIVPRLGPGPHAPVRIELALQPLGRGFGPGGGHGGGVAEGSGAHVPRGATRTSADNEAVRTPRVAPHPEAVEAMQPPAPQAPSPDSPPVASASATPGADPPPVMSPHVPAAAIARTPDPDPAAAEWAAPASSAAAALAAAEPVTVRPADGLASGATESAAVRTPNIATAGAQEGAASGSGAMDGGAGDGGGSVGPESLDAGFGLAGAVRLEYPAAALAQGRGGRARIEVEIEPDGSVARVSVLEETGGWGFGVAAQRAYASARFTPPRLAGRPVRVVLRKTIEFEP